jgi:O-antigen biosynthesis protein WbqP
MKRLFNLFIGTVLFVLLAPPMLLIMIAVRLTSKGPTLYGFDLIGKDNKSIKILKFRSILIGAPAVATHCLEYIYPSTLGGLLRRYSLDELPPLFSVLKGDMSFVGPRYALFNQDNLIAMCREKSIDQLLSGITGWAQVNGRDTLPVTDKVDLDEVYMQRQSLWMTFLRVIKREGVSH